MEALPGAAATAVAWRFRGHLRVTVIAKATFALTPGAPMIRVEPRRIRRADLHHGLSLAQSVRSPSDLAPYLPRADVTLTGHAYARGAEDTIRFGIFDGERPIFDRALLVRHPFGVGRVPLVYESAVGGPGYADNPLGVAVDHAPLVPTVMDPVDPQRTACFAPRGRSWPTRRKLMGNVARERLDAEVAQIPDSFDFAYYQAAPPDQQVPYLRGDECVLLEGVHPDHPRVWTRLPRVRGAARVYGLGAAEIPLALTLDTLRVDADEQRCTTVLRGSIALPNEAALGALRIAAGVAIEGEPLEWPWSVAASATEM